jgi:heat shock protein HslJ
MSNNFLEDIENRIRDILSPDSETDFSGTGWRLTSLRGEAPLEGTTITLAFAGGRKAAGSSGCNQYMTTYSFDAARGALSFDRTAGTMMACPEPQMVQEQRYLEALAATESFKITEQTLALIGEDGQTVAEFSYISQRLAGTTWNVTGYNNGKGGVVSLVAGTSLTAVFDDQGTVSGSSGCNTYSGSYTVDAGAISIGTLAGTRKMCFGEGVMEQEERFLRAMESVAAYRISGDSMELRREDGALAVKLSRAG